MSKDWTIREILEGYEKKEYTPLEVFEYFYTNIEKREHELQAFITLRPKDEVMAEVKASQAPLLPIAHKDIFSTKGMQTTAASSILKGYVPPFNATAVSRLSNKSFLTIGKLNCDAFAHGSTGENTDFAVTKNPYDTSRTPGGSSSGSSTAVAAHMVPIATGTDTGGSIRLPASFTNTVGIKPTYGRVSRYGVIAMTSSTDSIGHITKTVWDSAYILGITAGKDPLDATTGTHLVPSYTKTIDKGIKNMKIGFPSEFIANLSAEMKIAFEKDLAMLKELGAELIEISLPHTDYAINAYYVITPSEVSSNLARFDGIRYGFDRSSFGAEAKRRIMLGTYCLSSGYYDAYYLKAQKVRTLIVQDFKNAFNDVQAIVAPISPVVPPKLGSVVENPIDNYMLDVLTVPMNIAGVPSLAVPSTFVDDLPRGIQIIGNYYDEETIFQVGHAFEQYREAHE